MEAGVMPDILRRLGREVLVVDGAMGTMLQRESVGPEQCNEQLNVTNPDMIVQIHTQYVTAGADCVSTNSFGGTRPKLDLHGLGDQLELLNREAVRLARRSGAQHVLADVGPTGLVLEPLGSATYDEVFGHFAEQARALAAEEPDAFLLETFTDIAEARCALIAIRSVTSIPVIVSVSFGMGGRMELSGTDPETAVVILEACGAAAVGMNCGLGPAQMAPLLDKMAAATALPLIIQPNAGIPRVEDGRTVFPATADELGEAAAAFVDAGASLVGSCCGSTPAFTGAIADFTRIKRVNVDRRRPLGVAIAGPRSTVRIGAGRPLAIIGERINPTGKRALADSLREGSSSIVRQLAEDQVRAGADLLDVNVGAAGVDAAEALPKAVLALAGLIDVPLVLDTTDLLALEKALKVYPGRALVNSVNGGEESMDTVLPLAKTYGAAVVVLALDDAGIPADAVGRVEIVDRVRRAARHAGLTEDDLVVDCLVMTAATDAKAVSVTLEALDSVTRGIGLATVLGVSNVSHGLPGRPALNAALLTLARERGLTAAIYNPGELDAPTDPAAVDVLLGRDAQAKRWIARVAPDAADARAGSGAPRREAVRSAAGETAADAPAALLAEAVRRGDADAAPGLVDAAIAAGLAPERIVGDVLTPALQALGDAFGRGEVFLPQMMVAADAMKAAVARVKTHLPEGGSSAGRVAFATVRGDVHSIGKDICISLLESQDFAVDDLGVDVYPEAVVAAVASADVVCLSALMTTTLPAMEETVLALREASPGTPVLVGGAVVTAEWAAGIGAGYSKDAPGCVEAVRAAVAAAATGGRAER
jgi:5-methyltetrahydrofolate--homocysteine methyltransferase